MKKRYLLGGAIVIVLVAALLYFYGGSRSPSGQPPLQVLTAGNLSEIRNEFNGARNDVRVVLLLSPT
jgi:hypothetical protein